MEPFVAPRTYLRIPDNVVGPASSAGGTYDYMSPEQARRKSGKNAPCLSMGRMREPQAIICTARPDAV